MRQLNFNAISRRSWLSRAALAAAGVPVAQQLAWCARAFGGRALAPQPGTHPARAKQLILVFLTGGFSHVDTFDYKPKLQADHGKEVAGESLRDVTTQPLNGSPFTFTPRGESGLLVSELFPHFGDCADDLCVIRTLQTDILEHFQ